MLRQKNIIEIPVIFWLIGKKTPNNYEVTAAMVLLMIMLALGIRVINHLHLLTETNP